LVDWIGQSLPSPEGAFYMAFNRRGSDHRGPLFYRLLEQAVQVDPTPLAKLLGGAR
jgi:hypothetical protein